MADAKADAGGNADAGENRPGFQLAGGAPERYERYVEPIMAPFVTAVVDAAGLFPGARVLDLACGTGFAARAAALRAGPTGRVAGADVNEGMLRVAATHMPGTHPGIEFTLAPADALPYPDAAFDAVICQQGAQFFPDLHAALAETARVTRPGGRFAATVWTPKERSPYFAAQYEAVEEYGGPEAAANHARAFACAPDHLSDAVRAAGFHDVTAHDTTFGITLPPLTVYASAQLSALPWGQAVVDAGGPEALAAAGRLVCDRLTHHTAADGTATLPFTATLVTGVR
ncbi:class I SAM-dependent methyltransferase [Streptomyces sp. NPDC059786]|uniref:class I SAM-dependent methyltransferase n=1 Tax=Streptomyces sp. NPDC059786 TaxID=3346946 RepID=UPI003661B539